MSVINSIASSYTQSSSTADSSDTNDSISKTEFLELLVAQMQNQDPLNPSDTAEYTQQMTQYGILEQGINTNDNLETLQSQESLNSQISIANFMGQTASVAGDTIKLSSGSANAMGYTVAADSAETKLTITNSSGKVVKTVDLGEVSAGSYDYTWDGTDDSGSKVDDGNYTFAVSAQDAQGNDINVTPSVIGTVTGVQYSNGSIQLTVNGENYSLSDVYALGAIN